MKKFNGFTIMETLFVFGLMAIIGAGGMIAFGHVRQREELAANVQQVTRLITQARTKSVAGEDDLSWKINISSNLIQLQDENNIVHEQFSIPTKYSLTAPVSELVFHRTNGQVDACESSCGFTLSLSGGTLSHDFTVLFSGAVEY